MQVCPYDVTYCDNKGCPFKDCESHIAHTKKFPAGTMVSVADYGRTCRRYIGWLVDKVSAENKASTENGGKNGSDKRK